MTDSSAIGGEGQVAGQGAAISSGTGPLVPKASRATQLWLAVIVFVLIMLWLETRNGPHGSYNLFLSGDSELVGAEVFIDGKKAGTTTSSGDSGIGGAQFYGHVGDGYHLIEIRKRGFEPFNQRVLLRREGYLNVDLKPNTGLD